VQQVCPFSIRRIRVDLSYSLLKNGRSFVMMVCCLAVVVVVVAAAEECDVLE